MKYVYPAIFYTAKEGGYTVEFPDVEGAVTQGENLLEAIEMAEDALAGMLALHEDSEAGVLDRPFNNKVKAPTPIKEIVAEPDEYSTMAFTTLVKVDTDEYRKGLAKIQEQEAALA